MDDDLRDLVHAWLEASERDRLAALRLEPTEAEAPGYTLYGSAAFHRQQAAEKALKGYLAAYSIEFKKTHDMGKLVRLAAEADAQMAALVDDAITLAPFAVEVRYPGDWDELTADEYADVRDASDAILNRVSEGLARLG